MSCPGRPHFWVGPELCGGPCHRTGDFYPVLIISEEGRREEIPLTALYCWKCIKEVPSWEDLPHWYENQDDEDEEKWDWREARVTAEVLFERDPQLQRTVDYWLESRGFPKKKNRAYGLQWRRHEPCSA